MKSRAQEKVGSADRSDRMVRRPLTQRSLERMRLPRGFWRAEFARISDGEHKLPLLRYIKKIDEAIDEGYGVLLWGKNDVGKTGISAVILKEARRRGHTGLFLTAQQYLAECEGGSAFDDTHSVMERAKMVDMLALDDLGKETARYGTSHGDNSATKTFVARVFDDLVRTRQSNHLPTVIATNLDPAGLTKRYGKSFVRLFEERFGVVEIDGPSQRKIEGDRTAQFFSGK